MLCVMTDKTSKIPTQFINLQSDFGFKRAYGTKESVNVVGEDMVLYSQSLAALREVQAGLDFRYEEGVQLGIQKGREEGREEGRDEERIEIVRKMKMAGLDLGCISEITGLSPERIMQIQ